MLIYEISVFQGVDAAVRTHDQGQVPLNAENAAAVVKEAVIVTVKVGKK